MNMNICITLSDNITWLSEYLDFNQIHYKKLDIFNPELDGGRYSLDQEILKQENTLLVVCNQSFYELLEWEVSKKELVDFCNRNNHIWVWNNIDGLNSSIHQARLLEDLDQLVPPDSVTLFLDGATSDNTPIRQLSNIRYYEFPHNHYQRMPRIKTGRLDKNPTAKDFLLTIRAKRPHRDILWKNLLDRPNLMNRGFTVYHNFESPKSFDKEKVDWVGQQDHHITWPDGHPSMDLYHNAWLELVPETMYYTGYYFTEKTAKPIATKTPFLMATTKGYLKYLHGLGFQTFDKLIDEKYDSEEDLTQRMHLVTTQLEDIVNNGSYEFYRASQSILEHNHQRLAEISGKWQQVMDLFISDCLAVVDQKI